MASECGVPGCVTHPGGEPHQARRDDDVDRWLKRWRDSRRGFADHATIDDMLDEYRLHADTGTPLDAEVRENG